MKSKFLENVRRNGSTIDEKRCFVIPISAISFYWRAINCIVVFFDMQFVADICFFGVGFSSFFLGMVSSIVTFG